MTLAGGLTLSFLSAVALNWGWVAQHDAASGLPPLSLRRPVSGLRSLFRHRGWLAGFVIGLAGWALYVAALAVAPLSLVQAVAAGSVGLIAVFARRRGARLSREQLVAVALSVAGLLLLALSLGGSVHEGRPAVPALAAWLLVSLAAAAGTGAIGLGGAAAGVLYAAGDVATKGAVGGGAWLLLVPVVLAAHGGAFVALQLAFQRRSALASAGVSTLLTNALPIVAGLALFHEHLPGGGRGAMRIAAFALVVAAAALLARDDRPRRRPSLTRIGPPAALALLALATRLPGVWHNALSQDEVASARILQEPTFVGALHRVVHTESTPPVWYSLAWLTHHAGVPIEDVRLLSVAFGAALVVLTYRLACSVVSHAHAAFAAALVAVGYEPVYHGSELRAYELLALLAVVTCALLVRFSARPSRRLGVALGASVWAGLLTHYFFVYVVAAALAWLWLDPAARPVRRRATVAIVAGEALAAPWLPAFVTQYRADRFWWIGAFKGSVVVATPLRLFVPYRAESLPLSLAVIAVLAVGAVLLARRSPAGRLIVFVGVLPIVVSGAAWAAGERSFTIRNLIETTPFVAVCLSAALAAVPRRTAAGAIAATAAAAIVAVTLSTNFRPPFQSLAHALVAKGWRPSDPIAVFGNFFLYRAPLEWYLPHGPRLDVSQPTRRACPALFVVKRSADDFRVERLSHAHVPKHATVLAAMRTPPACVRLSTSPRLLPLA